MPEEKMQIDGKKFSLAGLMEIIDEMEPNDETRFSFSGTKEDYYFLKKHIENEKIEAFGEYEVRRVIGVSNKSKGLFELKKNYTVFVKRLK